MYRKEFSLKNMVLLAIEINHAAVPGRQGISSMALMSYHTISEGNNDPIEPCHNHHPTLDRKEEKTPHFGLSRLCM